MSTPISGCDAGLYATCNKFLKQTSEQPFHLLRLGKTSHSVGEKLITSGKFA